MKYKNDIVFLLDSILDDYYYLWECFSEYQQNIKLEEKSTLRFNEALMIAYENKYFNFFIGEEFNGEEKLIEDFELTNTAIEELLDYNPATLKEIRITTSDLGIDFFKLNQRASGTSH